PARRGLALVGQDQTVRRKQFLARGVQVTDDFAQLVPLQSAVLAPQVARIDAADGEQVASVSEPYLAVVGGVLRRVLDADARGEDLLKECGAKTVALLGDVVTLGFCLPQACPVLRRFLAAVCGALFVPLLLGAVVGVRRARGPFLGFLRGAIVLLA